MSWLDFDGHFPIRIWAEVAVESLTDHDYRDILLTGRLDFVLIPLRIFR